MLPAIPHRIPCVIRLPISNSGTRIDTPSSIPSASRTAPAFSFSRKKYGSRNVTKSGKVEKVSVPMATVDVRMDCRKVVQWMAIIKPAAKKGEKFLKDRIRTGSFFKIKIRNKKIADMKTRAKVMITAGKSSDFPMTPESPNKSTAE